MFTLRMSTALTIYADMPKVMKSEATHRRWSCR